jgi:chemotaxis response regulator CheB
MTRPARDIVVLGGSAGASPAARTILEGLTRGFTASVFVALHSRLSARELHGGLESIFAARTALTVQEAADEQAIEEGHVYVSPRDRHMVLHNGLIHVEDSPREQRFRPCVDVLFKSAAMTYGRRVIGVLLSGVVGSDGAAGLWQVRHRGGVAIVQDPKDARFPGMPQAALEAVDVDFVLPVAQIAAKLSELVSDGHASAAPRILVVEDQAVVATNLQESLTEMGYEVIGWTATGEAAIEAAGREHPDLVLMDIHLAGDLSGIETARRIWQLLQVPVVYCTAHADLETLKAAQASEGYGYVVKPFHGPAVRAAVELALARREKELR